MASDYLYYAEICRQAREQRVREYESHSAAAAAAPPPYSSVAMAQIGREAEHVLDAIRDSLRALVHHLSSGSGWRDPEAAKQYGLGCVNCLVDILSYLADAVVVHHDKTLIRQEDYARATDTLVQLVVETIAATAAMAAQRAPGPAGLGPAAKVLRIQCVKAIEEHTAHIWPASGHPGHSHKHEFALEFAVENSVKFFLARHPEEALESARVFQTLLPIYVHALTATTSTAKQLSPVYVKHARSVLFDMGFREEKKFRLYRFLCCMN